MRSTLVFLILVAGCANAPATPEENAAAVGGAAGCLAQGFVAAADSGKGEMIVVGLVLMPLCAMLASSQAEPGALYPTGPWRFGGKAGVRGIRVSSK